ncbi:putative E3 SUMO-protein ligase RNF212 isoform X3 [Myripristis murdjan]|uniref:Ring finger protein 212 n=1 Tax=Myripristis murdjan TaxID=586833 RepID=A0A667ZT11_9TELE|nr:probable E3 SUMO-protein ligase RNF212 isoform X3 [Myripristis murdjan]
MSYWVRCNSCFQPVSADRKLAVTTCGHVICSVCYQQGKQGECLICNAKCQVSPLSDKVLMFQARHQKRLLTHYQERSEKLEEVLVKMKQEMQQMTKKLNEQRSYITKLENCLKHQNAKASSVPQMSHSSHAPCGPKSVLQIPYNSPMPFSRHSSTTDLSENMEVDGRNLFRKPDPVPRVSLISPPQDGRMGTVSHRSTNQNALTNHSARSATVSRFQSAAVTPDLSYGRSTGWKSPVFKPPSSFRHSSVSSLVCLPP